MSLDPIGEQHTGPAMDFIATDPLAVCRMVESWQQLWRRVVVGHSCLYDLGALRREAAAARLHVDAWLLAHAARLFVRGRPRRACAVFFSVGSDGRRSFVRLTVSERSGRFAASGLDEIPGFVESGDELPPPNASLWAFWDGQALARVHDFLDGEPSGLMAADLGGLAGISLFTDLDEDEYEAIVTDPVERWDYSPIPRDFVSEVQLKAGARVPCATWPSDRSGSAAASNSKLSVRRRSTIYGSSINCRQASGQVTVGPERSELASDIRSAADDGLPPVPASPGEEVE